VPASLSLHVTRDGKGKGKHEALAGLEHAESSAGAMATYYYIGVGLVFLLGSVI
jgi:hypothetical protein